MRCWNGDSMAPTPGRPHAGLARRPDERRLPERPRTAAVVAGVDLPHHRAARAASDDGCHYVVRLNKK
jgi:hypothetical protein